MCDTMAACIWFETRSETNRDAPHTLKNTTLRGFECLSLISVYQWVNLRNPLICLSMGHLRSWVLGPGPAHSTNHPSAKIYDIDIVAAVDATCVEWKVEACSHRFENLWPPGAKLKMSFPGLLIRQGVVVFEILSCVLSHQWDSFVQLNSCCCPLAEGIKLWYLIEEQAVECKPGYPRT